MHIPMHIITRKALIQFWKKHSDSQMALMRWFKIVQKTEFKSFTELRQVFPSADISITGSFSTSAATNTD